MADSSSFHSWLLSFLLVAAPSSLAAQEEVEVLIEALESEARVMVGQEAKAPRFGPWLTVAPAAPRAAAAPDGEMARPVTLYAFYPDVAALSSAADYLLALRRRFAERGVRVVALLATAPDVLPEHVHALPVAIDQRGATASAWLGASWRRRANVIALDGERSVLFRGRLGSGVIDGLERAVAGTMTIADERQLALVRDELELNFDSMTGRQASALLAKVRQLRPRSGHALGLAYLAAVAKHCDAEAAQQVRQQAVALLASAERPLAVFADLALRGDPRHPDLARQLAAALAPATAAAPRDVLVQLAYLRALVAAGMSRQVGRHAMSIKKLALQRGWTAMVFAEILTHDTTPAIHAMLCEQALARAGDAGVDPRLLTALRYAVLLRCQEDAKAAAACVDAYVTALGDRTSINNDCWYFMTEAPTLGRFDVFANALADAMLAERAQMDSAELDTAALAKFQAGRVDEAVELQEAALTRGAGANAEYQERLDRYRKIAEQAKQAVGPTRR